MGPRFRVPDARFRDFRFGENDCRPWQEAGYPENRRENPKIGIGGQQIGEIGAGSPSPKIGSEIGVVSEIGDQQIGISEIGVVSEIGISELGYSVVEVSEVDGEWAGGDSLVCLKQEGPVGECKGELGYYVVEFSKVEGETGADKCEVVNGGELKSRRHLNVRGKSATLPSITEKDWDDIKLGVDNKVDSYAVSFVKVAQVVHELKNCLKRCDADMHVIVRVESAYSTPNPHSIITASDGAMVARSDLGLGRSKLNEVQTGFSKDDGEEIRKVGIG